MNLAVGCLWVVLSAHTESRKTPTNELSDYPMISRRLVLRVAALASIYLGAHIDVVDAKYTITSAEDLPYVMLCPFSKKRLDVHGRTLMEPKYKKWFYSPAPRTENLASIREIVATVPENSQLAVLNGEYREYCQETSPEFLDALYLTVSAVFQSTRYMISSQQI